MKRGSLFFIGLISAIVTIISLNFAFGNDYHRHAFYGNRYSCDDHYHNKDHHERKQQTTDSLSSNY